MSAQGFANSEQGDILEVSLEKIEGLLKGDYGVSKRTIGLLLLQGDDEITALAESREPDNMSEIKEIINFYG